MFFKSFWQSNKKNEDKKSVQHEKTDSFKYKTELEIRFADVDMMGHVNNAVFFTYLEIARIKYWQQAVAWDWEKTGVIIGSASIKYISPVGPRDKIAIYVRTSRMGNSSFDIDYIIVKTQNKEEVVCATAKTVCVAYDYSRKQAAPIPNEEKQRIIAFEQLA